MDYSVEQFDFYLPEELIAQSPSEIRDHSRLMVVNKKTGEIEHKHFYDIINYLKPGDVLVRNNSKVIPARLFGLKEETGAHVEVLLLKDKGNNVYECLCGNAKVIKVNTIITFGNGELKEEFIEKVKECGLEDKFRVVSAKTDVERYYSAMDVFVMPSIFEGLPITAIEAQCNGLPCVFSTYITQQVKLSSNCEFVDLEDKGKWIEVISNFSKSRYDGVKVITDNKFDIDSTVKMMEMIFEEL